MSSPPPRRRSSRLRGSSATPTKPHTPHVMHRLSALAEHDESPRSPIPFNMNSLLSSPAPRTPAHAGPIQPARSQMHPSIAQQSTAREPDSGLRLGFSDIPSRTEIQSTPSKIGAPSKSSFNFGFTAPTPQLSEEAQRLMDSLRDQANQIKAQLAAKHEEEKRNGGESSVFGARKIALPKPKAGRYSDVHMAEFKKMDSIQNHPSAFRAHVAKPTLTSAMKRTQSKANLNETEEASEEKKTSPKKNVKSLKRTQSKAQLDEPEEHAQVLNPISSNRLENTAPAKRARQNITDDASTARPVSRGVGIPVPTNGQPKPSFRSRFDAGLKSLTTPTKASAARASGIPTSASMANVNATPRGLTKSKTTGNFSAIPRPESKVESPIKEPPTPSKFERFKSMLHRNPSPSKVAASTVSSIPTMKKSPTRKDLAKELPSVPVTPAKAEKPRTVKHIAFTPGTVAKESAVAQETPSPKKSGIPRSATMMNMASYPTLGTNATPTASKEVRYPALSTPKPVSQAVKQAATEPRPAQAAPPMFTFRAEPSIDFGSSPSQASVRIVRPSILPSEIPGSYPLSDIENMSDFPTIPHGMSNKKRRRTDSDAGDEQARDDDGQSPSKKLKSRAAEGQRLVESLQKKILPGGYNSPRKLSKTFRPSPNKNGSPFKSASPVKGKGGLSMSRLNMLARPKHRK